MKIKKLRLTFYILNVIAFLLVTSKSQSQCIVEKYVADGKNIKVARPKPVVVETKSFTVVILGLSKYENDYYFINICHISKTKTNKLAGNVVIIFDNNEAVKLKILNSKIDNDGEFGLNCLTNVIVPEKYAGLIRGNKIKHFTITDVNGVSNLITPQRNRDILIESINCIDTN